VSFAPAYTGFDEFAYIKMEKEFFEKLEAHQAALKFDEWSRRLSDLNIKTEGDLYMRPIPSSSSMEISARYVPSSACGAVRLQRE
jgi:hypothetical protein